jgi:DNA-binding transcriptional MerR regulator
MNENELYDPELIARLQVGIGEVAEVTGVPIRKLRYWESKEIIQSRTDIEGGTRKYDYVNIKKVMLIKELMDEGYTLDAAAKKVKERIQKMEAVFSRLRKSESSF